MSEQKTNVRFITILFMVFAAIAMRIVNTQFPALSNFTPVGAVALFGGVYFSRKWEAYAVILLAIFLSNIPVNYLYTGKITLFAVSDLWMYGCFALMVFVGTLIKKVNVANVALASIISVLIHWLIMDLPWLYGTMYPHTLAGYGTSLFNAIPFEKNMVLGDLLYGTILFGGFELAKSRYSILQGKKQLAL